VSGKAGPRLGVSFFDRPARPVAADLIGCTLLHRGVGGRIVEAEAYEQDEPACHAFGGPTARNAPLFGPPGHIYVYLCYGIHSMFNFVTEADGVAAAVLIRALEPTDGIEEMRRRRRRDDDRALCSGPGKLCEALAIELVDSGLSAVAGPYAVLGRDPGAPAPAVEVGPRIGITKAAELPWRYCLAGSRYLSRPAG
jgi:DNA-3-methyladenine glycosylase